MLEWSTCSVKLSDNKTQSKKTQQPAEGTRFHQFNICMMTCYKITQLQ